jgi:NAD-dependent deacetylase sirtuin 2
VYQDAPLCNRRPPTSHVPTGIPDFRSPGTGLYDNLQKYNLPHPTAVFELDYFIENPRPFYFLAKELYPGNFSPTPAHMFVRLLQDEGRMQRVYTQNIDTLERRAGIKPELLVEAHGSFADAHCVACKHPHEHEWVKEHVFSDRIPTICDGLVKPDIVFFGEVSKPKEPVSRTPGTGLATLPSTSLFPSFSS